LLQVIVASFGAGLGALLMTTAVLAECPYLPPYPPVTEAVPSAREIIVGTVLESINGSPGDFTLRIDEVLRGDAAVGQVRRITYLYPNWPNEKLDGGVITSCTYLTAKPGDVIAIAYQALADDGRTRINAAGWIKGSPDYWNEGWGEIATLSELRALAALPPTDAAASVSLTAMEPTTTGRRAQVLAAVALLTAVATFFKLNRRGRRARR